jgi:hypothetical protein
LTDDRFVAFKDFDEFLEEPKAIGFVYKGKQYEVPADMPMPVLLKATQLQFNRENPGEGLGELGNLLEMMLGKQNWQGLVNEDQPGGPISINAAQSILEYVMDEVSKNMAGKGAEDELPEDPPTAANLAVAPLPNESPLDSTTTSDTGEPSVVTSDDSSGLMIQS